MEKLKRENGKTIGLTDEYKFALFEEFFQTNLNLYRDKYVAREKAFTRVTKLERKFLKTING